MLLTEVLETRHDAILARMVDLQDEALQAHSSEGQQFFRGFMHLLQAAAKGDLAPRDEYLATVIPAVRDAGFPLAMTLDSLVRLAMALVASVDAEHHPWLADFCGDYTQRLVARWSSATS